MTAFFKYFARAAAIAPVAIAFVSAASAQAPYPTRNITLVLPFAAGSGTDTTTRIISKELGTALGVGTVIDNKAGANGSIAASYVARSAPDGYTLFVTTNTTHSANPFLLKTLSYDPMKDFTPIARTGDLPFMLVINPEIPANSVAELIALAKKEIARIGLIQAEDVVDACVVRQPKAYPVYDESYRDNMNIVRLELDQSYPTLHLVGRNGMHKYNNQDHAMMTAMLTARNILAGERVYDIWNVNEDAEYHEAGGSGVNEALGSERLVPQKAKTAEIAAA